MSTQSALNTNAIAFIGIANEYCIALDNAPSTERDQFISSMLRLLPRLYIMATDLKVNLLDDDEAFIDGALDENRYEDVCQGVASLLEPDDVFLEVFEEDMKYSDTPVSASISEGLADIYQVLFNMLAAIRDSTDETTAVALQSVADDFRDYWSQTLCNVMRPLNALANQN